MAYLDPVTNFAIVTVSQGYDSAATSIVLSSGEGSKLPSTTSVYNGTWWDSTTYANPADDPLKEIVRVTARTSDTITVTRAQEGTGASAHNVAGKTYKIAVGYTKKFRDDIETKLDSLEKSGFMARLGSNPSITANTDTKLQFGVEDWDLGAEYDTSTHKYTAAKPTVMVVTIQARFLGISASGKTCQVRLYKNAALARIGEVISPGNFNIMVRLTDHVKLAATDTLEAYVRHDDTAARDIDSGSTLTFFSAQAAGIYQRT